MLKQAVAGLAGLGLIGGAGVATYNDDGTTDVTIGGQTVRLPGDGGKTYSCPADVEDKLSPHDIRAGRIKLTLRRVRREAREIEQQYPDQTAPDATVDRYNALAQRDDRLVTAFNREARQRNAILKEECD